MSVMMVLCLVHTWKHWRQVRNSEVCNDGTVSGTHLETREAGEHLLVSVMMVLCLAQSWKHRRQVRNSKVCDDKISVCDDDTVSGTHLETLEAGGEL